MNEPVCQSRGIIAPRQWITAFLCLSILCQSFFLPPMHAQQAAGLPDAIQLSPDIKIFWNYDFIESTDAKPFIDEDGRVQVPVRLIAEARNAQVGWLPDQQKVLIENEDRSISFTIGENELIVNGGAHPMDTAAQIVDDRVYVPVRFIAEALGAARIEWSDFTKTVYLLDTKFLESQMDFYQSLDSPATQALIWPYELCYYELYTLIAPFGVMNDTEDGNTIASYRIIYDLAGSPRFLSCVGKNACWYLFERDQLFIRAASGRSLDRYPGYYPYQTAENERLCYLGHSRFALERDGQFYHLILAQPHGVTDKDYPGVPLFDVGEPLTDEDLKSAQKLLDANY